MKKNQYKYFVFTRKRVQNVPYIYPCIIRKVVLGKIIHAKKKVLACYSSIYTSDLNHSRKCKDYNKSLSQKALKSFLICSDIKRKIDITKKQTDKWELSHLLTIARHLDGQSFCAWVKACPLDKKTV